MKKLIFFSAFGFCLINGLIYAHNGHDHGSSETQFAAFVYWLGTFHPMFVSYPIALVTMTLVAEFLFWRTNNPLFDHASRFMILAASILSIPTVISGLAFGYNSSYADIQAEFYWWHRFFGLVTMGLVIITAYAREYKGHHAAYVSLLIASFASVFVTGFLGGNLTFDFLRATSQMIDSF
jgi:uncharacterized membrane protein